MAYFKNILVGVDLSQCRPLEVAALSSGARETIRVGIELARCSNAKLLFFAALNLSEEALHHLDQEDRFHVARTIEEGANKVLAELASHGREQGVETAYKLVRGKGWLEIIRQVQRDKHDLAVVGTRDQTGLRRLLFGNTAQKLLRQCPCPVWVCKPGKKLQYGNILVATALKAGSALQYGIALGQTLNANVHVLHVVEYPLDRLGWTGLADAKTTEYHHRVRRAAEETLHKHLEKANAQALGTRCQVHLAEGVGIPDAAILHYLQLLQIDALVMGTLARAGLAGMLIGNTAERLLPEVPCSVLAIKPPNFQCPVA